MPGKNMVPRNASDDRLMHQERKRALADHTNHIKRHIGHYREHRDAIRDHLWEVYSKHLYLEEHDNFADWFEAQGFAEGLSISTAKRLLAEKNPKSSRNREHAAPNSDETTSSNGEAATGKPENVPLDMNRNPVPKGCRDAFKDPYLQETIDLLMKSWEKLKDAKLLDGMKKRAKFFPYIREREVIDGLGMVLNTLEQVFIHLRDNRPAAICPVCDGKKCPDCLQAGMVPREIYRLLQEKKHVPA